MRSNSNIRGVSEIVNKHDENSLESLFYFHTDTMSLEEMNFKLKEEIALQQNTLKALGKTRT